MPLHFSGSFYNRKPGDQNTYTTLDEIFKVLPKDQVIHIEIKNKDKDDATREVVRLIKKYRR